MKLSSTLISTLCLVIVLQVSPSRSINTNFPTQNYGEACSETDKCHSGYGTISCSSSEKQTCSCVDPTSMVYDDEEQVCVSKPGAMCYTRPLKNRQIRNCVPGAVCAGVSTNSVFGTCQETLGNEESAQLINNDEFVDEFETDVSSSTDDSTTTDEDDNSDPPESTSSSPPTGSPGTGATGGPGSGATGGPGSGATGGPGSGATGSPTTEGPEFTSTEVQSTTDGASWSLASTFLMILAAAILSANR